jgi:hypothetical protein
MESNTGLLLFLLAFAGLLAYTKNVFHDLPKNVRLYQLAKEWHLSTKRVTKWLEDHRSDILSNQKEALSHPDIQALMKENVRLYDEVVLLKPSLSEDRNIREFINQFIIKED